MEIMNNKKLSIVIMAAGRGTRMNSELPKVLHRLLGETLLNHVIETAEKLTPENKVTVLIADGSKALLEDHPPLKKVQAP